MARAGPAHGTTSGHAAIRAALCSAICWAALLAALLFSCPANADTRPPPISADPTVASPGSPAAPLANGRAELSLPRTGPLPEAVGISVAGDGAFLRSITLVYRKSGNADREQRREFHRLLADGETIAGIPAMLDGARLATIIALAAPGSAAELRLDLGDTKVGQVDKVPTASDRATRPPIRLPGAIVASATFAPSATTVELPLGRKHGPLESVIIVVRGAPLTLATVQLRRYDADPLQLDASGATAGPITDPLVVRLAEPEPVHSITLTRKGAADGKPSTIEVRAVSAPDWNGQFGRNRIENGGWSLLGTSTVIAAPQTSPDRANLRLRGPDERVRHLRFAAQRQPVRLNTIDLLMSDGRRETIPVNQVLSPGVPGELVKLPPEATAFVAIELHPVIAPRARIDAAIETWVQY